MIHPVGMPVTKYQVISLLLFTIAIESGVITMKLYSCVTEKYEILMIRSVISNIQLYLRRLLLQ